MNRARLVVLLSLFLVTSLGYDKAQVLKVSNSISIDAPADKVRQQIKDFSGLNTWHPALESDKIVAGTDNTVGAERLLTLKGGGTIKENLLAYNPTGHTFKYSILEGVLPVSHYTATVTVAPAGKGLSKVTWAGSFQRKDTSDLLLVLVFVLLVLVLFSTKS